MQQRRDGFEGMEGGRRRGRRDRTGGGDEEGREERREVGKDEWSLMNGGGNGREPWAS